MDKLSYEQLADTLNSARSRVAPGTKWQHYKGGEYTAEHLVLLEATDEIAVLYSPVSHPGVRFVRPLASWFEQMDWNGQIVPRFQQIG